MSSKQEGPNGRGSPEPEADVTREVVLDGAVVTLALEPDYWVSLDYIRGIEDMEEERLWSMIHSMRLPGQTVGASARLFIMRYWQCRTMAIESPISRGSLRA